MKRLSMNTKKTKGTSVTQQVQQQTEWSQWTLRTNGKPGTEKMSSTVEPQQQQTVTQRHEC
jgi:hypothetical protein